MHLELVSDLTKEVFIATLRRFILRGKPSYIYSNNGSSFIGGNNELIEFGKFIAKECEHLGETIEDLGVSTFHSFVFASFWRFMGGKDKSN
ncbi:hypothetical protein P5V15_010228 [Pogonomyrmex californicus]